MAYAINVGDWSSDVCSSDLKDGARTWLLNLAPGTISSWDDMRTRFIAKIGRASCRERV